MNASKKTTLGIVLLIALYIGMALLDIYNIMEIVIFPIIAIPSIIYFIKHTLDVKEHIVFQLCMVLGIYIVTGNALSVVIYLMSVFIPSFIIANLYKRGYTLPNTVMAATVIFSVVVFTFFMIMKKLGFDFEAQYIAGLDEVKNIWLSEIDKLSLSQNEVFDLEYTQQIKSAIVYMVDIMKPIYSATIIIMIMSSMGVIVIVSNTIARIKNKTLPSAKQFLEFKLSKATLILLLISVLAAAGSTNGVWAVLGLNVMVFLTNVFQIVGLLAVVGLVAQIKWSKDLKVFAYIMLFILLIIFNSISISIIMTFGCLDTLFNYRKAKIVV